MVGERPRRKGRNLSLIGREVLQDMVPCILIESLSSYPLNHSPNYPEAKVRILVVSPRLFIVEDTFIVILSIFV